MFPLITLSAIGSLAAFGPQTYSVSLTDLDRNVGTECLSALQNISEMVPIFNSRILFNMDMTFAQALVAQSLSCTDRVDPEEDSVNSFFVGLTDLDNRVDPVCLEKLREVSLEKIGNSRLNFKFTGNYSTALGLAKLGCVAEVAEY